MKILSTIQIREADAYTIANEPIASVDLMERASKAFVRWFVTQFDYKKEVYVFCGTGNNGGDGLAISRLLLEKKYGVKVFIVNPQSNRSEDFETNYQRLLSTLNIVGIEKERDIPSIPDEVVVIDGLFGSGLSRKVEGLFARVIESINKSNCTTVAIDMPSGLLADEMSASEAIVKASYTVAFQLPKLAFMVQNSGVFVGSWKVVEIGLDQSYIKKCETNYFVITEETIKLIIPPREKYGHKGTYGRALLVAGSYGKMGAAILSSRAAMRSGLGLLTIHSPKYGVAILQSAIPEAMVSVDSTEFYFGEVPDISNYDAVGIGPGLDQKPKTVQALTKLLNRLKKPAVIDADAINIIANNRELLSLIPEGSILTPHHREFERLVGVWKDDFERLTIQKEFSKKYKVIVVFKGPHTTISTSEGCLYFNNNGNPGMATAGSGDVLTGLVTGFLTQGYSSLEASLLGVYIHGLAGDVAAKDKGMASMIASDIVDSISKAVKLIS